MITFLLVALVIAQVKSENKQKPSWIYEEDGVEYVDATKRNDTLKLVYTQAVSNFLSDNLQFFDNFQANFIN